MRILFIALRATRGIRPRGGGVETIRQLTNRWFEQGHEVHMLACKEQPSDSDEIVLDGIKTFRTGYRYTSPLSFANYYRNNLQDGYDIVVELVGEVPTLTPLYVRGPHMAIGFHFMGWTYYKVTNPMYATLGLLGETILPIIYKSTPFLAVSSITAKQLDNMGIKKVYQTPPALAGIDTNLYKPGSVKDPDPTILFVGRLDDKRKRVSDLLSAVSMIKEKIPNLKVWIVGGGVSNDLLGQAEGLPVHFWGEVDEATKIDLYQKAWVFVSPSMMEGFGLTYLEANACGTPAVACRIPNLDTVQDNINGLLSSPYDVPSLSENITKVLTDDDLRHKLTEGGIYTANQYSWDRCASEVLDIFREVISLKKSSST